MKEIKLGVIDSGLHHQITFRGYNPDFIRLFPGAEIAPERYDILVIPFHSDHELLGKRRKELENFIIHGGILLILGASDLAGSNWIPFCTWTAQPTHRICFEDNEIAQKILGNPRDNVVAFYNRFHTHGALIPHSMYPYYVIARGDQDRNAMILFEVPNGGSALITTLDPDHHSAPTAMIKGKKDAERDRQQVAAFLSNLISFCHQRALEVRYFQTEASWDIPNATKIFLSHKGTDKPLVREFAHALEIMGFDPWFDEESMAAGRHLRKSIYEGMKESCAAVFFITPDFVDKGWLEKEIDYAEREKQYKKKRFSIITIVFENEAGKKGIVPETLKSYVYKEPATHLRAFIEIIRALPILPGNVGWKAI